MLGNKKDLELLDQLIDSWRFFAASLGAIASFLAAINGTMPRFWWLCHGVCVFWAVWSAISQHPDDFKTLTTDAKGRVGRARHRLALRTLENKLRDEIDELMALPEEGESDD